MRLFAITDFFEHVGRLVERYLATMGAAFLLLVQAVYQGFTGRQNYKEIINQMSLIGYNSMPIVLVTVAFSAMVLAYHTATQFVRFGASSYVGGMVAVSVAREIAPVLTAVVVVARVGSSIAAEIGSMQVTEQIDALRSLAVSPVKYLVTPRLVACLAMLPVLTVFAGLMGVAGGYLVAVFSAGVNPTVYKSSMLSFLTVRDVWGGLIKAVVFGGLIAVTSCQKGLNTRGGAAGVGRTITSAVVASIIWIYIVNYFLSVLLFPGGQVQL